MSSVDTADLVLLALREYDDDGDPVPYGVSAPGIGEALGADHDTVSDRIELLSALSTLADDGLVTERVAAVETLSDERKAYFLTEDGRRTARSLVDDLSSERVTIRGPDGERTVRLDAVDCFDDRPMIRALARRTDDGVVHVGATPSEEVVDRETARDLLADALDAAVDGTGRTVRIAGPAGVGKTTVLTRLVERARNRDLTTFVAACRRDGAEPYQPFRAAFDDVDPDLPAAVDDAPLEPDRAVAVEDADDLADRRAALFADVAQYLRTAATETPVVLAVDDAQWLAEPSAELFARLVDDLADAPVLLVACYRPGTATEDDPLATALEPLDGPPEIDLDPFDRATTRRLVESLCETPEVPAAFVDAVYDRTDGNPMFVTGTVTALLEEGVVDPKLGVFPEVDELPLPSAARTTVERRLEGLDPTTRELLELAATNGETTPLSVLSRAVDADRATVVDYVDALVEARLLRRDGDTVAFASSVVREGVLAATSETTAEAHERLARAHATADDDRYAAVARHREAAGDRTGALAAYREAAAAARSVYAHELAIERFESALALARDLDDETAVLEILDDLATIRFVLGDLEAADRACQYVTERTSDERAQRAFATRSKIHLKWGEFDAALDLAEEGLALSETDSQATCHVLGRKGWALMQRGDPDAALSTFERRLEMARSVGDGTAIGDALHDVGTAQVKSGAVEAAVDTLESAVQRREEGNLTNLSSSLNNLGLVHWKLGDLDAAAEYIERAADIHREVGDRNGQSATLTNLGVLAEARGDYEAALAYYDQSRAAAEDLGDERSRALLYGNVATASWRLGRLDAALEQCRNGIEISRDIDDDPGLAAQLETEATILIARGETDRAREAVEEALAVAESVGDDERLASVRGTLGRLDRIEGNVERAIERHRAGRDAATGAGTTEKAVTNLVELVRDHLAAADHEAAVAAAEDAVGRADELEDPYHCVRARLALCASRRATGADVTDAAAAALEDAVELGASIEVCRARYELGRALVAAGETAAGEEALLTAIEDAERTGATRLRERAAAALERVEEPTTR